MKIGDYIRSKNPYTFQSGMKIVDKKEKWFYCYSFSLDLVEQIPEMSMKHYKKEWNIYLRNIFRKYAWKIKTFIQEER